jgi:hypothetical protein
MKLFIWFEAILFQGDECIPMWSLAEWFKRFGTDLSERTSEAFTQHRSVQAKSAAIIVAASQEEAERLFEEHLSRYSHLFRMRGLTSIPPRCALDVSLREQPRVLFCETAQTWLSFLAPAFEANRFVRTV